MLNVQCPCCGELTLEDEGTYEICPICNWEGDPYQRENPEKKGQII
ncbi:CPCC family cysteine-rich protein [Chitiniphilus shinanonensis]